MVTNAVIGKNYSLLEHSHHLIKELKVEKGNDFGFLHEIGEFSLTDL